MERGRSVSVSVNSVESGDFSEYYHSIAKGTKKEGVEITECFYVNGL